MSFEGFYQYICKNGHAFELDVFVTSQCCTRCPICKEVPIWQNLVDQTNCCVGKKCCKDSEEKKTCEGRGIGYIKLEKESDDKYEECKHCCNIKCIKHETYKIPSGKGHMINQKEGGETDGTEN